MRTAYNILFIENENDWIDSIEESMRDFLEDKWFTLVLERSGVFPNEIVDFNRFDVIVVDLNLDEDQSWDKVIKNIRSKWNVFTEILFYSSEWEKVIRQKLVDLGGFDWVYCSHRNNWELMKNLKWLIYTTIRKTQDLNNLRWMVMAETSELDELIRELNGILVIKWKVSAEKITERKDKLAGFYSERMSDLEQIGDFHSLLYSTHFSAFFSWRTLKSFMGCNTNDLNPKVIDKYKEDIIELRNLLAHNPEADSTPEIIRIKGSDGVILSFKEEDFARIRKKILAYKELLSRLKSSS